MLLKFSMDARNRFEKSDIGDARSILAFTLRCDAGRGCTGTRLQLARHMKCAYPQTR